MRFLYQRRIRIKPKVKKEAKKKPARVNNSLLLLVGVSGEYETSNKFSAVELAAD
jgi:hypothetical protein